MKYGLNEFHILVDATSLKSELSVVAAAAAVEPLADSCMCLWSVGCKTNSDCCAGLQCNAYYGWSQCVGEEVSLLWKVFSMKLFISYIYICMYIYIRIS
jgi:hypothetical protein